MGRTVTLRLRELWAYYLAYTKRPLHTATAAAFAIFGLLVFVDPAFAALAIAVYVVPPVVLYVIEDGVPPERTRLEGTAVGAEDRRTRADGDTDADTDCDDGDTDTDSDSADRDTDADSDDGDTDSDRG